MKVNITTDNGEVLEIIIGYESGAADHQIIDGDLKALKGFAEVVKETVILEGEAMMKRGKPL